MKTIKDRENELIRAIIREYSNNVRDHDFPYPEKIVNEVMCILVTCTETNKQTVSV